MQDSLEVHELKCHYHVFIRVWHSGNYTSNMHIYHAMYWSIYSPKLKDVVISSLVSGWTMLTRLYLLTGPYFLVSPHPGEQPPTSCCNYMVQ